MKSILSLTVVIVVTFVAVITTGLVNARPFHSVKHSAVEVHGHFHSAADTKRDRVPMYARTIESRNVGMESGATGQSSTTNTGDIDPNSPSAKNPLTNLVETVTNPTTTQPLTTSDIEIQYKGESTPEKVAFGQCIPFKKNCQVVDHAKFSVLSGCIVFTDSNCQDKQHPVPFPLPPTVPIVNAGEVVSSLAGSYKCYKAEDPILLQSFTNQADLQHYLDSLKNPAKLLKNLPPPTQIGGILLGGADTECHHKTPMMGGMEGMAA